MKDAGVLIVGGGLAAQRCAEALRRRGYDGPVRIACAESEPPYDRPPLSKEVLAGAVGDDSVAYRPGLVVRREARSSCCSAPAPSALDPRASTVGARLRRRAALREAADRDRRRGAAAAVPRRLRERPLPAHPRRRPPAARGARARRAAGDRRRRLHRPGGRRDRPQARCRGDDDRGARDPLAPILGDRTRPLVRRPAPRRGRPRAHRPGDRQRPRQAARRGAGPRRRRVDRLRRGRRRGRHDAGDRLARGERSRGPGIRTDTACRTRVPGVFAAGDASLPFDPRFGTHARTEHWDAAAWQGAAAAQAMLGAYPGTPPLPSFWSDQYGSRIQYVGHAHHADDVVVEGDPGGRDFEAVFTRSGSPVAGLAVGRPRSIPG